MAKQNIVERAADPDHASLAVLIDADNASSKNVDGLFEEIAKYGTASVKRIYGDWTAPNLAGWKDVLLKHSVQPIQQFAYTKGKNATDSSMIIDAMDLLYTKKLDGFCLVSSDSDFTRLAARLREEGLTVYGFGEDKTPKPFVNACDKFIYTRILRSDLTSEEQKSEKSQETPSPTTKQEKAATQPPKPPQPPLTFLANVIDSISDDDGWANLGTVGQNINKRRPDFDSRLYGFSKLSQLFLNHPVWFELRKTSGKNYCVKNVLGTKKKSR